MDILINVVGFIPLGFLLAGYLKHKGFRSVAFVFLSVAVGFGISLLIEILQAFLPSRLSSIVDLITNTSGTMIGCLVLMLRGKIL
jgi:glycopeptide antibiotics resistance protein